MREPVALLSGRSLTNQKHRTPSRFPRGGSVVTQFEKMTAWRRSIPQQKKLGLPVPPHMPVTHDASKALWRGLEPILCVGDDGDFRPGIIRWLEEIRTEVLDSEEHVLNMVAIHAQGMTYGTQSSVFETGIDDKLSLNMVMFRHDYAGIAAVVDVGHRPEPMTEKTPPGTGIHKSVPCGQAAFLVRLCSADCHRLRGHRFIPAPIRPRPQETAGCILPFPRDA